MSDQRTRTRPANHDPRKRRIRSCTPDLRSRNRVRACHGLPFVGAARPHTPRLPPLPRRLTPEGKHPGTRTINDSQRTSGRLRGRTTGHGQRLTRRYSSQPGGSIFNAHLAQSSVSVSTPSLTALQFSLAMRTIRQAMRLTLVDLDRTFTANTFMPFPGTGFLASLACIELGVKRDHAGGG